MAKAQANSSPVTVPSEGEAEQTAPDAGRIASMLEQIASTGVAPRRPGITRLAYSEPERAAHRLFAGWLEDLGLSVHTDAAGNTIAELPGTDPDAPAIGIGSHLDSVPDGGRYDGIVGVVGAVEVARCFTQRTAQTAHPLRLVAFAAEEGARFGEPCIGSKIVARRLRSTTLARGDREGVSLAEAMSQVGVDPQRLAEAAWDPKGWAAFLELHIEQARVLESVGRHIGLVDSVSGSTRIRITVLGQADHSGGTPMHMRTDALAAAAEIIVAAERLANEPQNRGARITVGQIQVSPNSITTISGQADVTVDIRDLDWDRQRALAERVVQLANEAGERRGARIEVDLLAHTTPVVLPMWIRTVAAETCAALDIPYRVLPSGAGHDAQVINAIVPAGIVFVPSRDGLSHVPEEWTNPADIALGVTVLCGMVDRLDALLSEGVQGGSDDPA
jgi:hydantoinase/carbamoylase family amidase